MRSRWTPGSVPLETLLGAALVAVAYVTVAASGGGYSTLFQAAMGLLLWWTVIIGLAARLLPRAAVPRAALAAGLCLAAYAVLTGLSVGWASDDGQVFVELTRASAYLGAFALVVLLSTPGGARPWLTGIAAGLVVVAALALGSRLVPSLFPAEDIPRFLPTARARLSYPVNYWNGLAACMAGGVVLLAWLGAAANTRLGRALAVGLLPLPILTIFLTSSRGGAGAGVVALIVLLLAAPARIPLLVGGLLGGGAGAALVGLANQRSAIVDGRLGTDQATSQGHELLALTLGLVALAAIVRWAIDRPLQPIRLPVPPRPVLAAAAAVAVLALVGGGIALAGSSRLDKLKAPPSQAAPKQQGLVARHFASGSGSGRYQFWQSAWKAFKKEPARGIGAGAFESWWARTRTIDYVVRDAHSWYIESLAELGVGGLALTLAFVLAGAGTGLVRRLTRAGPPSELGAALALLTSGAVSAALDWTWELPAAFLLPLVAVALLTGPACGALAPRRRRRAWGLATVLAGCAALVVSALALGTQVELSRSRDAVQRGDLRQAAKAANSATAIQPWAAEPRVRLALIEERQGNLKAALTTADKARERAPDDWRLWLTTARLRARTGDVRQASRDLRRARRLNPRSPTLATRAK